MGRARHKIIIMFFLIFSILYVSSSIFAAKLQLFFKSPQKGAFFSVNDYWLSVSEEWLALSG
jgi:hypothetical protein